MLDRLRNWDGKSVNDLENVSISREDLYSLIANIDDDVVGIGASWLIKRYSESGLIEDSMSTMIIDVLLKTNSWEIQLHFLQILEKLTISSDQIPLLYDRLSELTCSDNKFIRAWSYNGLYVIACVCDDYKNEVFRKLDFALIEEAPSVKARIRKIVKIHEKKEK